FRRFKNIALNNAASYGVLLEELLTNFEFDDDALNIAFQSVIEYDHFDSFKILSSKIPDVSIALPKAIDRFLEDEEIDYLQLIIDKTSDNEIGNSIYKILLEKI